jgi:TonB family protein
VKFRRLSSSEHRVSAGAPGSYEATSRPKDSISGALRFSMPSQSSVIPRWLNSRGQEKEPADQVVQADVALNLVLEQIVYQARLSTCATGAFIGLIRRGEMVYCAMNGSTSAEFVAYLRRDRQVVEACLRSSSILHIHNSDNSSDLDISICKSVGARAIVLVPVLTEGSEKLGVLGAYSPQADGFVSGDLVALQSMSHRVANTVGRMREFAYEPAKDKKDKDVAVALGDRPRRVPIFAGRTGNTKAPLVKLAHRARRSLPAGLVVGASLLVGWALTRNVEHGKPRASHPNSISVARSSIPAPTIQAPIPAAIPPSAAVRQPVSLTTVAPVVPKSSNPATRAKKHLPNLEIETPVSDGTSGIVVFDGKEAKSEPTANDSSAKTAQESSSPVVIRERAALEHVINRVEPEYPEEAKARHVRGAVVLDVLVGRDGKVQRSNPVQGDPLLMAAAAVAVKQWRFKPFVHDGRLANVETHITLTFALP